MNGEQMVAAEGAFESAIAVVNCFDLEAFRFEILADQSAKLHVVVDDQNAFHLSHISFIIRGPWEA